MRRIVLQMRGLPGTLFGRSQLLQMERLSFLDELLSLILERLALLVHHRLKLFEVSQFDLQLLHLRLHK